jgi:hypothetical protein
MCEHMVSHVDIKRRDPREGGNYQSQNAFYEVKVVTQYMWSVKQAGELLIHTSVVVVPSRLFLQRMSQN